MCLLRCVAFFLKNQNNVKPNSESKAKNRSRNITWFHPPYSKHVATNVGKKFLSIVKDCFKQNHPLRKIFNKNILKISYSCMPNLEAKITNHNKAISLQIRAELKMTKLTNAIVGTSLNALLMAIASRTMSYTKPAL